VGHDGIRDAVDGGGGEAEVGRGVDVAVVDDDVEVQVAARRPAGRADEADDLALLDDVALLDEELRLVAVGRLDAGGVLDDRAQAPRVGHASVDDGAVGGCVDGGAAAGLQVDAGVEHRPVEHRVDARTEGRHLAAGDRVDEAGRRWEGVGEGAHGGSGGRLRGHRTHRDGREHEETRGVAEDGRPTAGRDRVAEQG
jgi:hypothetical protein